MSARDLSVSLAIGLCCLLVYNANRRAISAGDAYPARYIPFAIWQYHTVLLDPIARLTAQGRADAFWMVPVPGGHIISLYPVVVPVLIAPLYLPAIGYLHLRGWTDWRLDHVARVMEKLAASLVAALSASLLYLLLRRRAAERTALLLTVAYAFGTTTWVISSQALWQHGIAALLVIVSLLFLTAPCTAPRALATGLLCGLIAANRPPDVILAAALGAYALFWAGRRAALVATGAVLPTGLVLLYNLAVAGHLAGGYGLRGKAAFFQHDILSGLGGLLFSPTRGLFVFSPFLLFLALAWRFLPRDRNERALTLIMSAGVVLQILLYARTDWRAGISWGPRYLTDMLPMLMWILTPVAAALRGLGRVCFLLAVGVAVAIEAIGAFCYTGSTDAAIFAVATGPQQMRAAWDWRNAPFVASFKDGLAPAELMIATQGSFDTIDAGGRATSTVTAGANVVAAGWALAGHATPWQVAVVIDGTQTVASRTFYDGPEVHGSRKESSPARWRIPLDTAGLAPGEHELTAFAWASEKGDGYYLGDRKLTTIKMRGNFDAIEVRGRATSFVIAGEQVVAAGWALAGHATPSKVSVIIDGRQTITSRAFFDRPDVRKTLHETSPAGWRIPLDAASLAPGEHHLTAFASISENGEDYYLGERKLTVTPRARGAHLAAGNDLSEAFRTAAARIREHQQKPGYWLTTYTSAPQFAEPRPEMNTFLTSLMVDLLDPLAATSHLSDSLQRARRHLTGQIESSGLVRYHGRPDAPGIGTLGCAITPDADDTALVWRLAPGNDRQRLASALRVINQYRTSEGLYRTWLAPRDAYQCIDPGRDPDPADITIQMHVLLLLAKVQPPAGRLLCEAIQRVVDEDRVWVYYRMTPLVPMLRLTDLQHAGCNVELPPSRMRTSVQGQEIWVSLVRLLGRAKNNGDSPAGAAESEAVLRELAKDDFALLRKSPPLLYHNDLTATVRRYYWSEDAGYALWLRLYDEHVGHRNHAS